MGEVVEEDLHELFARELEDAPTVADVVTRLRPGLTGPWQVSGRNELEPEVRMILDVQYWERQSFLLDLTLLFKTIGTLLKPNGY